MEEEIANLFKNMLNNSAVLNKVEMGLYTKLNSQCPAELTEWENVSSDELDDIYFLLKMIRTIKIIKIKTSD